MGYTAVVLESSERRQDLFRLLWQILPGTSLLYTEIFVNVREEGSDSWTNVRVGDVCKGKHGR